MQTRHAGCFWVLITAMGLLWFGLPAWAVEKQASKGKIALVNGSVITQEDFDREMSRVQRQLASRGQGLGNAQLPAIQKEVLESLISRELLYQESQTNGIKVEEGAIGEQLNTLKKRFPNEEEFKNALAKMNLTEADVKSQITMGLAIQQFIDNQFVQKIKVSDKETKAYYDGHPDLFKQPEQVRGSHILIKVDPGAKESEKAEARKKIQVAREKLQKGGDFAALAQEFSQGPSATKGGDLGYFRRGQMVKPFEEAAFALKPGDVSGIVETRFGYHLIKVTDKKPKTTIPYEDVKNKLQEYLKQEKVQAQLNPYIEELKGKAKIERFLAESSK